MLDYIIVGQGLAGTTLGLELIKRNYSCVVVDDEAEISSSKVAAGVYNPIVFKRLTKSWNADNLIEYLDDYYNYYETLWGSNFHHKKSILKIFVNEEEKQLWLKKAELFPNFLDKMIYESSQFNCFQGNPNYGKVLQAGNINVSLFLELARAFFKSKNSYQHVKIDYNRIKNFDGQVQCGEYTAKRIIFCEGYKAVENPFFENLPFVLTKGEILKIKITNYSITDIVNKGVFVLPLKNDYYLVGATYDWKNLTEENTKNGIDQLIEKLKKLISLPFKITETYAGVRPTVSDRRPLIGKSKMHENVFIFNGFGTKGVMYGPLLSKQFADFLQFGTILDSDIDINRFY